ncbi:MAG: hypothetical protein HYT94_02720, partial [Parcubacteria group bacterium]|nr:hypothetical protein [Parcubacteria group bacterium]
MSTEAEAAFNKEINYQGKLTNASGVPVADGTYHMTFRLYTTATSATTTNIWEEDRSTAAGNRITITGGLFSVLLGSSTSLTNVNFNQTLYLGVEIGGSGGSPSWDGEMTPRKKLGAVPAAFTSERFDGFATTSFLRSDAANSTTTASTFLTVTNNGAGNIAVFTGSGNVGVGTTSPYAKFSVAGSIVGADYDATTTTGYKQGGTVLLTASATARNTFLGLGAGTTTTSGGLDNTFLGYWAGQANTTGDQNTGVGVQSLFSNTTGDSNTAIGMNTLYSNTTGIYNTANGYLALYSNTTGNRNTANGYRALYFNTTGTNNIGMGHKAGYNVTTGYNNIFLGNDEDDGGTAITTGFNNIGMGYNIKFPAVSSSNMMNIGNFLFANLPATTSATTLTTQPLTGRLGVGTSSPYAKLTVWGQGT